MLYIFGTLDSERFALADDARTLLKVVMIDAVWNYDFLLVFRSYYFVHISEKSRLFLPVTFIWRRRWGSPCCSFNQIFDKNRTMEPLNSDSEEVHVDLNNAAGSCYE